MSDMVAAMRVGEKGFGTIRRPFHRPPDFLRRPDADRLLGIDEDLRAEAAADIRRDHAQLVLRRDADEGREHEPRHMRVLAGRVEREDAVTRIVVADGSPRLHRVRHEPVVDEVELGDVLGGPEGLLGRVLVAEMPVEHAVVGRLVMDHGLGADRLGGVDHRRQLLIIDRDRLGRVARLRQRLRHNNGDMVADIAHLTLRQRRMRAGAHRRAVLVVDHPAADQTADLVGGEIVSGEDAEHARHAGSGFRVDRLDLRMRMRRAQEIGMGLARPVDVVGIAALAGDETVIFLAADCGADSGGGHGVPSSHGTSGGRLIAWNARQTGNARRSARADASLGSAAGSFAVLR